MNLTSCAVGGGNMVDIYSGFCFRGVYILIELSVNNVIIYFGILTIWSSKLAKPFLIYLTFELSDSPYLYAKCYNSPSLMILFLKTQMKSTEESS